jgi:hypothetical protein
MSVSKQARHAAIQHVIEAYPSRALLVAIAQRANVAMPSEQGVEGHFALVSRFVISAERAHALEAIVEAAVGTTQDALREALLGPVEPLEPETTWEVDGGALEISDGPPRPVGTPATAPPIEGARTWLVRGVELSTPASVAAGTAFVLAVTLGEPPSQSPAPKNYAPYDGLPVEVEVEAWLEEAYPAGGADLHRGMRVPAMGPSECGFELLAADPLPEGVGIAVRFFFKGYEVGRARCTVAVGDGSGPPALAAGVIVIPDSILDAGEDAVATVTTLAI